MKNELRTKILEMTLAAFGASACASTQAANPGEGPLGGGSEGPEAGEPRRGELFGSGLRREGERYDAERSEDGRRAPVAPGEGREGRRRRLHDCDACSWVGDGRRGSGAADGRGERCAAQAGPGQGKASKPKPAKKKAADDEVRRGFVRQREVNRSGA